MKLTIITESTATQLARELKQEYPQLSKLWITDHKHAITLDGIEVQEKHRNQGIGSKVLDKVKEYAKSVGKPLILIAQPEKSKKSALNRFYKRAGFKLPGRDKNFGLPRHTHIYN